MTAARLPGTPFGPGHPGEALSALLDGELDEREAEAVGRHLADCVECRREMSRLSEARLGLRALNPVPAPPELAERTRARIGWVGRVMALGALVTAGLAGVVLWAARPEPVVTALPPAGDILTAAATSLTAVTLPSEGASAGALTALPLSGLPPGYVAPTVMDGMVLQGVWRQEGVLAAVYGAGGARLVLVEQAGRLIGSPRQQWTVLDGHAGEMGAWGGETTFASQVGAVLVVTAVGSGQDVAEVAGSLGSMRVAPPWTYRARSLARSLVDDITGA